MNTKYLLELSVRNLLFWISRKIDYPLIPPDVVQINFTFRCNLRCKMCSMHEQMEFLNSQGRQVEIDSVTLKKVIEGTKDLGAKAVLFIGGEPLLRKDLFELIAYAKSLSLGTVVITNGVLLNEEVIERCFETGMDWFSISIDAATEQTFSKIRGENILGKIIDNIEFFNDFKKRKNKEFPKTAVVCTIMGDNLEELLAVVHLCEQLKIERVLFQPVVANNIDQTQREANFAGFIPKERWEKLDAVIDELINYKKKSLRNFDFIGNSIRNLELIKRYFRGEIVPKDLLCYAGYNRLQIVQEGKLYFCVNQEKYDANFGDISKDSLKSLWFSQKARFYRRLIRKCKFPCLQWCSYRDEFYELAGFFQKKIFFR